MITIFAESITDRRLLERLLADLGPGCAFRVIHADGRDAARPLARTHLAIAHQPVALVMDAETTDTARIMQLQRDLEDYFLWVSQGVPFRVVQFIPEVEVVFFHHPEVLRRFLGDRLDKHAVVAGRFAPRAVLEELLQGSSLTELIERLTEEDLEELRKHETVAELRSFVESSDVHSLAVSSRSA
ncbi:MAG TPA: hypothetical protein VF092_11500 [Longimicrobium sp.]